MLILWFIIILLLIVVVILAAIFGLSWYISNKLLHRTPTSKAFTIPVTTITTETVTLKKTANTQRPGIFGITGAEGQAIVGPIVSSDAETVTRQLLHSTGILSKNVAWNTTVYGGALREQHLTLPMQDVLVPSGPGDLPAWFVPGTLDTWAILVHGASGTREQGLRFFRTLADLGFPILDITYRGDEDAPASVDGLTHLGDTEWQDLESAVYYALAQGAQHILLYGISLGGTIVETFLRRSSAASTVQAVVLDSPVLDWNAALVSVAKKNKLPVFIAAITKQMLLMRTGIAEANLDLTQQSQQSQLPVLLFHGISDTTAPIAVSDTFASTHDATITYHRVPDAEHTQCWNADSQMYEATLRSFLSHVRDGGDISAQLPH